MEIKKTIPKYLPLKRKSLGISIKIKKKALSDPPPLELKEPILPIIPSFQLGHPTLKPIMVNQKTSPDPNQNRNTPIQPFTLKVLENLKGK